MKLPDRAALAFGFRPVRFPLRRRVRGVCGMLGLEPLDRACEGRLVIFAPKAQAEKLVGSAAPGAIFRQRGHHWRGDGRAGGQSGDGDGDRHPDPAASAQRRAAAPHLLIGGNGMETRVAVISIIVEDGNSDRGPESAASRGGTLYHRADRAFPTGSGALTSSAWPSTHLSR